MPQPGMNGMEPAFAEAYVGHRGLLSPYPLAMSPQGGRTEYDQSVLLMLGSPASPRKRPFELLSDLVDDGGTFGEDLHPERWDVSALDEMARYTRLGQGELLLAACSEDAVLIGRWGSRNPEEVEKQHQQQQQHVEAGEKDAEDERKRRIQIQQLQQPSFSAVVKEVHDNANGERGELIRTEKELCVAGRAIALGQDGGGGTSRERTVEVYQVAEAEEREEEEGVRGASGLNLELCSEEHNYSLTQGEEQGSGHNTTTTTATTAAAAAATAHKTQTEEGKDGETQQEVRGGGGGEESQEETEAELEEEEEDEDDDEEGAEETAAEAELSSSSETECEVEAEPVRQAGERPSKRRCFWEYRRARESNSKKKLSGDVRWSLSWSSSTLPSTLYRREGKKGRRKARKTDASDLTPNPVKLQSIGEQLQQLNAAIDGMGPVNELPAVARARSRKEKNKLASRACRLKKKAQHEANKIKLWGLNQEYENLLGALLRIKEVIRLRVESSEEEDTDERGMTQRLEDILRESSGPLVAGRTKDFVQRILAASAVQRKEPVAQGDDKQTAG